MKNLIKIFYMCTALWIAFSVCLYSQSESNIEIGAGASIDGGAGTDISADSKTVNGTLSGDGTWNGSEPLPVELSSFTALAEGNAVLLNWTTATEVNNYGMNVERRMQSAEWEEIGFVKGSGNSNSTKLYSFEDKNPPPGHLQYRLKQIDFDGKFKYSDVVEVELEKPANFSLQQNYPNPFNPITVISYQLPVAGHVYLKVFDILGREVATLVNSIQQAGKYNIQLSTNDYQLSSGVYLYSLTTGNYSTTRKMIVLK